jgi:hypothetical protein
MKNNKIAKAMQDAEALGFEFESADSAWTGHYNELVYFFRRNGLTLQWMPGGDRWAFSVRGEGSSPLDAINKASFAAQACTSAPAE